MSSSSSTSNSKSLATKAAVSAVAEHEKDGVVFNALERLPARKMPWAVIVFVLLVVFIETGLRVNREWFADRAAWQWEVKKEMLAHQQLSGDIAIMGTSVLFHGVDALRINQATGDKPRVVNLALNGMQIHHIAQTLEDQLEQGNRYDHVLVEMRDLDLSRESWVGGPYWRLWATWDDLLESRIPLHEPSLVVPFAANRTLTSFNYRQGLDNWVFASAKAKKPTSEYRNRNQQVGRFMIDHLGYSQGEFPHNMANQPEPIPKAHPFAPNLSGSYWFEKLLATCEKHNVKLTLLVPPAPPYIVRDRAASNYNKDLAAYVASAQTRHPNLQLDVLRFEAYTLADFADDHHFSPQGTDKLTQDVAGWVKGLKP